MELIEKTSADLKAAMKAGDETKVSTLRMLLAAQHNREIEKRTKLARQNPPQADLSGQAKEEKLAESLTEEEVLEVVMSEAKKRREAIEGFEKGGRAELAQKEKQELVILEAYLPQQLSDEEIAKEIDAAIQAVSATTAKDTGKVMGYLSPRLKGKADMGKVFKTVAAKLTE